MKEIVMQHELDLINIAPRKEIEVVDISRKRKTEQRKQEREASGLLLFFFYMTPVFMFALWLLGL